MDYSIYALRVSSDPKVKEAVADHLGVKEAPQSVRLATFIPLSNQGYPADTVGGLLRLDTRGALVGVEGRPEAPIVLVPWQNIGYLAEGLGTL